ncbi:MAG: YlxR family protein [Syntrophomonas sp.]|uniref:RNase P modulator RnpM n=1 Tax=Syntrophomonas sp. TaxID=2053627 RepID=UPI00261244D4|nr:YlxR family protein [Syntrophomonas sp.]MDD2510020.1 YlxR family protein [Syntrophomonas sp.]MDD3879434.1 YlxR family protein [Syntrophomonas sp.]MDD4626103.1 YlxR family protein [Syntrophomonas sp.]
MTRIRKQPQRMCVGCREMKNKRELVRIVRSPQGEIELDTTGKKPGRGAYICPEPECIKQAIKGKRLQKALEQDIPAGVMEKIREQIDQNKPGQ